MLNYHKGCMEFLAAEGENWCTL